MDVTSAIRTVRAVRRFEDRPVPWRELEAIVDAARRVQSAKNTQPCEYVVVTERGVLVALAEVGPYARHLAAAAAGIFVATPPRDEWTILFDTGQAVAYLQLAAWERGIASCIGAMRNAPVAREILGLPEDRECWVSLSLGYPPPGEVARPRRRGGRRTLAEILHRERW